MGDDALRAAQAPTLSESEERLFTVQEAAVELDIRPAELLLAIKAGSLSCTHHFGRHMISKASLEVYRGHAATPDVRLPETAPAAPPN